MSHRTEPPAPPLAIRPGCWALWIETAAGWTPGRRTYRRLRTARRYARATCTAPDVLRVRIVDERAHRTVREFTNPAALARTKPR